MTNPRVGIGYDIHRLVDGRELILGGVRIPSPRGLLGHSDADVVLHALADALLGAIGAPDLGELFSDTDPRWRGADSRVFVEEALARTAARGLRPAHADVILHAEQPRLSPHKPAIRQALIELLGLPPDALGLKARSNEGLDAVGRAEAIACWVAVVLTPA